MLNPFNYRVSPLFHRAFDHATWERTYDMGLREPRFPVPAIPLQVVWPDAMNYVGYQDMIFIDDLRYGEDDPQMVRAWDFYQRPKRIMMYWFNFGDNTAEITEF